MLQIKTATEIVVIGGGPVGVELAGEIATDLADKKVTLIHSKPEMVDGPFTESFRKTIHDQLVSLGIKVLLGNVELKHLSFFAYLIIHVDLGPYV